MAFMPERAPLVVLGFLFVCLVGLAGAAVFVQAAIVGNRKRARKVLLGICAAAALYGVILLGISLASREKLLAIGEEKYFCEIDCHLAYSVQDVATASTLGTGDRQARAAGTFYAVRLRTWFDERTISSRRAKDMPLSPNLRWAVVVDEQGRRFGTSLAGMKALEEPAGHNIPLAQSLRPGESYETLLVFDLPPDVRNPRLLLTDPLPVNWLLIGHENSFFHKKIFFALEPQPNVAQHP